MIDIKKKLANLNQFFQNVANVKERVEENPGLADKIREIIRDGTCRYSGGTARYSPIEQYELGLKRKYYEGGIVEACMTADIYSPEISSSPFAVVINPIDKERAMQYYLVKDFGEVQDLELYSRLIQKDWPLNKEYSKLMRHLRESDYHPEEPLKIIGWSSLNPSNILVMHDLGPESFELSSEITKGCLEGTGVYELLKDIKDKLVSDKYRLDLKI